MLTLDKPAAAPPAAPTPTDVVGPDEASSLLARAAGGDDAAWATLVVRYSRLLGTITRSFDLAPADAADVIQVVWLRLFEHIGSIRDPRSLSAWLTSVARRECLRVVRTSSRECPVASDGLDQPVVDDDVADRLLRSERTAILAGALDRLSPRCRALLDRLMAESRPSYEATAVALRMPVGSIGPTRQRCLGCLRDHEGLRAVRDHLVA